MPDESPFEASQCLESEVALTHLRREWASAWARGSEPLLVIAGGAPAALARRPLKALFEVVAGQLASRARRRARPKASYSRPRVLEAVHSNVAAY